ncbi:unnamed protein product, partial [marine sediment metagenome]
MNNNVLVDADGQAIHIKSEPGGMSKLLLEDEGGEDKLDVSYNDTTGFTNISANNAQFSLLTNAGNINVGATGGDLNLSSTDQAIRLNAATNIVLNNDVLFQSGTSTSDYLITHHQDRLFFQATEAAENAILALASEDADGTDAVGLEIFRVGNVDQTNNSERLEIGTSPSIFRVWSTSTGT